MSNNFVLFYVKLVLHDHMSDFIPDNDGETVGEILLQLADDARYISQSFNQFVVIVADPDEFYRGLYSMSKK